MSLNSPDFLQHFPYPEPRPVQAQVLEEMSRKWNDFDCFVLVAPTAFGKSAISKTLMTALSSVSVITPTNLLVEQYLDEFPDTPSLRRLDSYWCDSWQRPCPATRARTRNFCSLRRDGCKCPAAGDLSTAKYRRGPGIYNYHIYQAHQIYRDILVVDEAHNLLPYLRDRNSVRIWQHDYKYPHNMWSREQIAAWVSSLSENKRRHKKIALLEEAVRSPRPRYVVQRTTGEFAGKGTLRGEPEERDCLQLLPVDVGDMAGVIWPHSVEKIVLMSATIGEVDIRGLGLGKKRVLQIDCESPIPLNHRPIVALDLVNVNRNNMEFVTPLLAREIDRLADWHQGEKGVVHATYQLSGLLREHLIGDRYLFHDRENKREMYQLFRESPPEEGRILVACGMYEGIDLPDDSGRWQVITKTPWPSLGNPAVQHLMSLDERTFLWETIKTLVQGCGRICRTPEDFGVTYLLDKSLQRLWNDGYELLPKWWREAVILPPDGDTE